MTSHECLLATLPGSGDGDRLLVVLARGADGRSGIALIQQSWAEGIGWYDQKRLDLAPEQLRQLKRVLGWVGQGPRQPSDHEPVILSFPRAASESA
ncbi:MAG: hypothetical protein NZ700_10260 [Gemmataceae bacterium]|nr:hypothetical protein [Gemmataceae bacterium]MDW8266543.1 hypothetical protein [Gemmataceae bacterium]